MRGKKKVHHVHVVTTKRARSREIIRNASAAKHREIIRIDAVGLNSPEKGQWDNRKIANVQEKKKCGIAASDRPTMGGKRRVPYRDARHGARKTERAKTHSQRGIN